jgi:hypothetical protein
MRKLFNLLLLIAFALAASGCGIVSKSHKSEKLDIAFKYPSGWSILERQKYSTIGLATHTDLTAKSNQSSSAYPELFVKENAIALTLFITDLVLTLDEYEAQYPALPEDELKYVQIGDYYAEYYETTEELAYDGPQTVIVTLYTFQGPGGRLMNVRVVAHSSQNERAQTVARQVIESLRSFNP